MGNTALNFIDAATGTPRPNVFERTTVVASSHGLGWDGVVLEHGTSQGFEPDGVCVAGHFLSMNAGHTPLDIDIKYGRTFERRALPPGTFFVQPAGVPMVQRNHGYVEWAAVEIPSSWAQRMLGRDLSLEPDCGHDDAQLTDLMRCMIREVSAGCPSGPLFSEAVLLAFAARLARSIGMQEPAPPRRGLTVDRLRAVQTHVEDALAERLTLLELAGIAGLSLAHFAREFKRATGEPPHTYITRRRLERAAQLLTAGVTLAEVAAQTGFSDQAHLSRAFRRRYGLTPGAFQRAARR